MKFYIIFFFPVFSQFFEPKNFLFLSQKLSIFHSMKKKDKIKMLSDQKGQRDEIRK